MLSAELLRFHSPQDHSLDLQFLDRDKGEGYPLHEEYDEEVASDHLHQLGR